MEQGDRKHYSLLLFVMSYPSNFPDCLLVELLGLKLLHVYTWTCRTRVWILEYIVPWRLEYFSSEVPPIICSTWIRTRDNSQLQSILATSICFLLLVRKCLDFDHSHSGVSQEKPYQSKYLSHQCAWNRLLFTFIPPWERRVCKGKDCL